MNWMCDMLDVIFPGLREEEEAVDVKGAGIPLEAGEDDVQSAMESGWGLSETKKTSECIGTSRWFIRRKFCNGLISILRSSSNR